MHVDPGDTTDVLMNEILTHLTLKTVSNVDPTNRRNKSQSLDHELMLERSFFSLYYQSTKL